MSRYIDLDTAIPLAIHAAVEVVGHGISQIDAVKIADKLEDATAADVVEVVRCQDCLYVHFNSSSERYTCQRVYPRPWVEEDDFCSYGRREGNV